jgi:hypothetical protein
VAVRRSLGKNKVSERRVCQVLEQARTTQRYVPARCSDESALVTLVVSLACQYGGYGYRIITALIPDARDGGSTTSGWNGSGSRRG